MILVCGGTGLLGSRIVEHLLDADQQVRALVRPDTDPAPLRAAGVAIARGDLRGPMGVRAALAGVDTVVTCANAVTRMLDGDKDLTIADVDLAGNLDLIRAATEAGVRRFVFVSAAGLGRGLERMTPLTEAKWHAEEALRASGMESVIVRPDMLMEIWLDPLSGIDADRGRAVVYGRGQSAHRYISADDLGALCAALAVQAAPPRLVEAGGPEALTRNQVVAAFASAVGKQLRVRHVPRGVLDLSCRALWNMKPALASILGMALFHDIHPSTTDDAPLHAVGIQPRSASDYIQSSAAVP
ncbi:MAG: SDR family oxidoreductase [Actinomycetota bacterium]